MSIGVQIMLCLSLYLTARAIFVDVPSVTDHFFILPLSDLAGGLPIFPSGLGTFEAALTYFYNSVPTGTGNAAKAVIVALALRVMQIVIAAIGAAYYVMSRREVGEVIHAASRQSDEAE